MEQIIKLKHGIEYPFHVPANINKITLKHLDSKKLQIKSCDITISILDTPITLSNNIYEDKEDKRDIIYPEYMASNGLTQNAELTIPVKPSSQILFSLALSPEDIDGCRDLEFSLETDLT